MVKKGTDEFEGIRIIVDIALNRILSRKTKRTYQAELHIISKDIEKFIKTTYITKESHVKETLEQVFGHVNELNKLLKTCDKDEQAGIKRAIKELEKIVYK